MESKIEIGAILVTKPSLQIDIFSRSVVLIVEHTPKKGSVGFILNKKSNFYLNELLKDIHTEFPVFEGGPVEPDNLFYIHKRPDIIRDGVKIYNDIYWAGNFEDVVKNINNGTLKEQDIRFFMGYSGWAAYQLQGELKQNMWYIDTPKVFDFFSIPFENLWKEEMKKKGNEGIIWMNMPEDPTLN